MQMLALNCCGVKEITGLSAYKKPEDALNGFRELLKQYGYTNPRLARFAFVIFTQAVKSNKYGKSFAEFLVQHDLGEVTSTDFHLNPNSNNQVKVWVWALDRGKLSDYYTKADGVKAKKLAAKKTKPTSASVSTIDPPEYEG